MCARAIVNEYACVRLVALGVYSCVVRVHTCVLCVCVCVCVCACTLITAFACAFRRLEIVGGEDRNEGDERQREKLHDDNRKESAPRMSMCVYES